MRGVGTPPYIEGAIGEPLETISLYTGVGGGIEGSVGASLEVPIYPGSMYILVASALPVV